MGSGWNAIIYYTVIIMIVEIYAVRTATKITSKTIKKIIKKIILIMLTPND